MTFEDEIIGMEKRFTQLVSWMCVVIGGVFLLFALISSMDFIERSTSYAALAIALFLFPLTAKQVFKHEERRPSPPPILPKKRKK